MVHFLAVSGLSVGIALMAALSWKWGLPARLMTCLILLATALGALTALMLARSGSAVYVMLLVTLLIQLGAYVAFIAYRFYRDPERVAPTDPSSIASPADGKVIYVRRIPAGRILRSDKNGSQLVLDELQQTSLAMQDLWQVGISMVFTDVHVNRAPISGRVVMLVHRPGRFLSLRLPEAVNQNERQTIVLDNGSIQVAIVQIASRLVRRIEAFVGPGQEVGVSQRIGMIKFGSQVDIFLPANGASGLFVNEGDQVIAGETILVKTGSAAAAGSGQH
jgi:phosphatidylserine decarboxylase